jgi:ABC-type Mn2+/Zn2+ transport system permease subunit
VLAEPFYYEFFRHGMLAATLVGALTGLIGVYVILRRMSYIGHGLSHAIFGGAVVSYVMSVNFYIGAGIWGFLSAVLINWTARTNRVGADAAIGIITTASFAIGVALISRVRSFTRNFEAALFGNVLGVTMADIWVIAGVAGMVVLVLSVVYKQMLFTTFDPEVAPSYGVPTGWMDTLFALLLAGTIVASIQIMGVMLIAAGLVIPPVIARQLTNSFNRMLFLSTGIGAFSGFSGMYLSYHADVSSGAMIVLVSAALFMLALVYNSMRHRRWSFGPSMAPAPVPMRSRQESGLFE